jgi:hypothetical protein
MESEETNVPIEGDSCEIDDQNDGNYVINSEGECVLSTEKQFTVGEKCEKSEIENGNYRTILLGFITFVHD